MDFRLAGPGRRDFLKRVAKPVFFAYKQATFSVKEWIP